MSQTGFPVVAAVGLVLALGIPSAARAETDNPVTPDAPAAPAPLQPKAPWCANGLETLGDGMCAFSPDKPGADKTLVVFLHGVIKPDTNWQWAQQNAIVRSAKRKGFSVLMPRGRRGIGPAQMKDWWTWPTSVRAQRAVQAELFAEWKSARKKLEERQKAPFRKVLVIGFSNGAYFATALALLGTLPVNGYGMFAGGAGAKYLVGPARGTTRRPPIYVGYGLKDRAHKAPKGLAKALKSLGWPHKEGVRKRGGHSMGAAQLDQAIDYLRSN